MKKTTAIMAAAVLMAMMIVLIAGPATASMRTGGDRLAATQNLDGGWGWPLSGASATNTIGPVAMGLAQAYRITGDAGQLAGLQRAATYLQSKTVFSPSDGYIAVELDSILGGTANADYVKANFYDKLAAGTYLRSGVLYDTAGYVNRIRTSRSGDQANMAAWDIGTGIVGAQAIGASTSEWITGTEAEVNELDSNNYYDVIGLAGALYGLKTAGVAFDPTGGSLQAAGSLSDLAGILAGYQLPSGGFTWNSGYMGAGSETNQETAYAMLALNSMGGYAGECVNGRNYLMSVQLASGGWDDYVGDPYGENNEITGEALWASGVVPEPSSFLILGSGVLGVAGTLARRRRAR